MSTDHNTELLDNYRDIGVEIWAQNGRRRLLQKSTFWESSYCKTAVLLIPSVLDWNYNKTEIQI